MERTYDIFEVLPDGKSLWRCAVTGHEPGLNRMRELASESSNEFRMMHLPTKAVVAIWYAKDSYSDKHKSEEMKRSDSECGDSKDFAELWIPTDPSERLPKFHFG
jgi:hypothetical protein